MTDVTRRRLETTVEQATRDLEELTSQVEAGEIDPDTAAELRATYERERAEALRALDELGSEPDPAAAAGDPPAGRSPLRMVVGATILVAALGGVVYAAVRAASDTSNPALQGDAASAGPVDPASVSNETMEAVIAANLDNPQINGMRFALANRYFDAREYAKAFPHFQAILENDPPPELAAASLIRLGWMVYDGNGEVDLAISLLDQALQITPDDSLGLYLLSRVEWCGAGDPEAAVGLLERAMADPGLDADTRTLLEADLAAARSGGPCP